MPDAAPDTIDVAERFNSLVTGFKRALLVTRGTSVCMLGPWRWPSSLPAAIRSS